MIALWRWYVLGGALAVAMAAPQVLADALKAGTDATPLRTSSGLTLITRIRLAPRGGIGFDDLFYSPALNRLLAPAGATGIFYLVDPTSYKLSPLKAAEDAGRRYRGGHDDGITSADSDGQRAFTIDRTTRTLLSLDVKGGNVTSRIGLTAGPDYVRYVASTRELWITEPDQEQIEIVDTLPSTKTTSTRSATIRIAGGPESLAIDQARNRAYSHLWRGQTVAIDIASRQVVQSVTNGCKGSRGIALDTEKNLVFVGCSEGRIVVLDERQAGKIVASASTSAGVDSIAYNAQLRHLYVPSASDGKMSVYKVAADGALQELGRMPTAVGAHCVASDERQQVWVCDPDRGELLVFKDR